MNARLIGSALFALCLLPGVTPSRLAANDSKDAKKLYQHAETLLVKGEDDAAISEYREAIALKPNEARYHVGLALALDHKGDLHSALEEHRRAQQLDPKNHALLLMCEGLAKELETPEVGAGQVYSLKPGGGGDVTEPIPTYHRNPEYSDEARQARLQGSVTLSVVIDASGRVSNIRVLKPVGFGLDEKAVEAVSTWRFKPARRKGEPVSVRVPVEVSFRFF
jgi:TonB family protein